MFRSRVVRAAVAVVALLVPVGVASAGTTEPGDEGAAESEPASSTVADSGPPSASESGDLADTTEAGAAEAVAPPIDPEFQIDIMLGLVPDDEAEEYYARQSQDAELAIQACMNEAGFDYEPMDQSDISFDQYNGMTQLEWAQQYGFGMWTQLDPENNPYQDQMMEWPNDDIVGALTPSEQNAWYEVNNRCNQTAYAETNDPWMNPMVQQIMEDFGTQVENDPRVRDALAAWQECMADAGHPFASQEEVYESVYGSGDDQEMWELQSQFYESEAWLDTSPDHAQWQELVDQEIEIAVADATCTPPLEEVREEVRRDLRPQLVEVWQTIDWSLPPVTFEDFMMTADTVVVGEPEGSAGTTEEGAPSGSGDPTETTETPVGLDLGDPPGTTEP